MRFFFAALLATGYSTTLASSDNRVAALFAGWELAQRDMQSLVIELVVNMEDSVTKQKDVCDGTLKVIRTPKGEILGSYELVTRKSLSGNSKMWTWESMLKN